MNPNILTEKLRSVQHNFLFQEIFLTKFYFTLLLALTENGINYIVGTRIGNVSNELTVKSEQGNELLVANYDLKKVFEKNIKTEVDLHTLLSCDLLDNLIWVLPMSILLFGKKGKPGKYYQYLYHRILQKQSKQQDALGIAFLIWKLLPHCADITISFSKEVLTY